MKIPKIPYICSKESFSYILGNENHKKNSLNFRKWNVLAVENLNKTFLYLILDKMSLGETACLSNLYYLLAAQASRIHSQNCSLKKYIFENCFL